MPPITREEVRSLAAHTSPTTMTTCYLEVDGRRFARHQDLAKSVDSLLRRTKERVNGNTSVHADLRRIAEYVKAGVDRSHTRTLAFFSCHAEDFWHVVALPTTVPTHVVIGYSPAVGPLETALSDHPPTGVLLVDKARVRMFVFGWGELVEHADLVDDLLRGYDDRGEKERGDVAAHVDAHGAQHLRMAARVAFDVQANTGFERLVIGGPEPIVAEVERLLHTYLQKRHCGRLALSATASLEEVRRATETVDAEITRRHEAAAVAQLKDAAHGGTKKKGVLGLRPTLEAVASHRVERLLVSQGYAEAGWRCGACGRLAAIGPSCPGCGERMGPVEDVVSELVDRALAEGLRVDVCVDNADLDVIGRIGARLRF
jgi:hypothetical protein